MGLFRVSVTVSRRGDQVLFVAPGFRWKADVVGGGRITRGLLNALRGLEDRRWLKDQEVSFEERELSSGHEVTVTSQSLTGGGLRSAKLQSRNPFPDDLRVIMQRAWVDSEEEEEEPSAPPSSTPGDRVKTFIAKATGNGVPSKGGSKGRKQKGA